MKNVLNVFALRFLITRVDPKWLFCIMLFFSAALFAQGQIKVVGQEGPFPVIQFDTLQIVPQKMACSAPVSAHKVGLAAGASQSKAFCCIARFSLDPQNRYRCYLMGVQEQQEIWLFVQDHETQAILLEMEAARLEYIPGTMRSLTNAWIVDSDGDGLREIFVHTKLIDYEFPTELGSNISGDKMYVYRLIQGKLEFFDWPGNLSLGQLKENR